MNKSTSLLAALAAVVLTGSAFAYSPTDSASQAAAVSGAKLVPTKVVSPTRLPRTFTRSVVNIEFSLDQSGQPRDIKVLSTSDRALKEQIVQAFSQWKFETASTELIAGAKRFILPLEIVPEV
jgi:outer membrane biosynthesis protein TonB